MKKIYIQSLTVLLVLLISSLSYAQKTKSQTQELKGTAESFVKAEAIKKVEDNLIKALGAERNRRAVTTAMKKFWKSAKGLNKQQVGTLFQRFSNASKTSLKKLVKLSPSQLSSYAKDITSNINIDAKTLKQIISGTGDKAGNATLKIVSELDDLITKTGKAPKALLKLMRDEASGLDPKQAKAFYKLLKKKLSTDWADIKNLKNTKDGLGKYVGTVVDGVFVLSDAYDIYYSDDEPEIKAIKATSKIIDYSASTGAGVASAALGGGLGPGLVIAFSANRVSTLYTEMAMLRKELQDIEDTIENRKINNGVFARGQLIKISQLIKLGQLKNAKFKLIKLRHFLKNNDFINRPMLSKLRYNLEEKLEKAKYNERVNIEINKARFPYIEAYIYYKKGVELNIAKHEANQALKMLRNSAKSYPEINKLQAIPKIKRLLTAINKKIANAADFIIAGVATPKKKVYVGESIDFPVFVKGGIPYYSAVGAISSNISDDTKVTMYWQAPSKPGIKNFTIKLKDCMGSIASALVSIKVVEDELNTEGIDGIVSIDDFSYGQWSLFIDNSDPMSGGFGFTDSQTEAIEIIDKKVFEFLDNPSYNNSSSNFVDVSEFMEGTFTLPLIENGLYTYQKKGGHFIITSNNKNLYNCLVVKLIDDNHFVGIEFKASTLTSNKNDPRRQLYSGYIKGTKRD